MDIQSLLKSLPPDFWFKTTIFAIGVALAVLAYRIYRGSNKIYLTIVVGVIVAVIFFNWVYNRTEPKWMTPMVDKLAHFFPTKDYAKQEAGNIK
jgi:multisubunit Na+/H+ antiporter MnhB subunit